MKQAHFRADNAVFDMPVSKQAKLLYLYLCRCADEYGRSFPSVSNMAWACSMSETLVRKAIRELEQAQVVIVSVRQRANGSQTSNLYHIGVVQKNWFFSPDALFEQRVSCIAKLVYLYLCRMAKADASSYPSRKRIAAMCGCSLTSLRRAVCELAESQLLVKNPRYRDNGGQSSNLYCVQTPVAQPRQTKLRLIEGGKKEENKPKTANSLAKQRLFILWTGGMSKCAPLEGIPTWGTVLNRKENTYTVFSNLVPETRPP